MVELHGRLTIVTSYLDEDKHPEINEKQIYSDAIKAAAICPLSEKYVIESFHSLIKREWLNRFRIKDFQHAYKLVFEYIDAFYNTIRIHWIW